MTERETLYSQLAGIRDKMVCLSLSCAHVLFVVLLTERLTALEYKYYSVYAFKYS